MSNKTDLRPGDKVQVVTWHDRRTGKTDLGGTTYMVMHVDGYHCLISEVRTPGGLCAPQPFDTELLRKVG
jgi:hypothetical protein